MESTFKHSISQSSFGILGCYSCVFNKLKDFETLSSYAHITIVNSAVFYGISDDCLIELFPPIKHMFHHQLGLSACSHVYGFRYCG